MSVLSDYFKQVVKELREKSSDIDIRPNELLSRHTTLKVGGPADILVYPHNDTELEHVMAVIRKYAAPWRVLGRGSNLVVRDGGIRGIVIKLDEGFSDVVVDGTRVIVGGGFSTIRLATMMTRKGLTGFEFAGGIPGNIGGAVYMNAGAHGWDMSDVVVSAEVLLETGERVTLSNQELQFAYRKSALQSHIRGIVTQAVLQLSVGEQQKISTTFAGFKNHRKETQPLQFPCAGSIFRNPPGDYAGNLIEKAGLKGYRIGDAEISILHANFIINRGAATANDVLSLIDHIIEEIDKKFNIRLKPEVLISGEDNEE